MSVWGVSWLGSWGNSWGPLSQVDEQSALWEEEIHFIPRKKKLARLEDEAVLFAVLL